MRVRTSAMPRIMAYAEIYVTDTMWPDFDRTQFHTALRDYQSRERRFGKVGAKRVFEKSLGWYQKTRSP